MALTTLIAAGADIVLQAAAGETAMQGQPR
jgi:hypothetical protein